MQRYPDSHGHLTKWLLTATYWRLGLCPQNFTSTGHWSWILLSFNFILELVHFVWLQPPYPIKESIVKNFKNIRKLICMQKSAYWISFFFLENNVRETISARFFWFHLQPGRYKLCIHKIYINSAGFLFTHSWKYLFHTKNTRESPVVPQAISLFFSNSLKLYK